MPANILTNFQLEMDFLNFFNALPSEIEKFRTPDFKFGHKRYTNKDFVRWTFICDIKKNADEDFVRRIYI